MDNIADRVAAVQERMAAAARRAGRTDPIELVAVSKTHPPEYVAAAAAAGVHAFGENRVQEAERKIETLAEVPNLRWHLIGHLQTNKAKKAAQLFGVIQTVDSLRLAELLNAAASRRLDILVQVNVSGEATKEGFDLADWETRPHLVDAFVAAVERIAALPNLAICGLMTIAPWGTDPEAARPVFARTRRLRDLLAQRVAGARWDTLSMGMTDDFAVAIEEGATVVRVGRAIFGER